MSKTRVRFKLNLKGLNELMKSPEMQSVLADAGRQVADVAGDGFCSEVHVASYVAISNVYTENYRAFKRNLRDNNLLDALGSVGLPMTKRGG